MESLLSAAKKHIMTLV